MALDFTSATGNLFNRLGRIFGSIVNIEVFQLTGIPTIADVVADEYNNDRDIVDALQSAATSGQGGVDGLKATLNSLAASTLIEMVQDDSPQPSATLDFALPELIAQMISQADTVDASVTTIGVAAEAANNGNGECLVSIIDGEGNTLENVYDEIITVKCVSDSQPETGQTTINSESFNIQGEASVPLTSFNWPKGSGGSTILIVSNPAEDATNNNFLTNGAFELFTANAPDSWVIIVGTPVTTIDSTTTSYVGTLALAIIGTGAAELTKISQELRNDPVTAGSIAPQTRYAIGVWIRVSSVPAAGVLQIALKDGTSGGASIVGGASLAVTLSGETTTYAFHSFQINAPAVLPTELHMVIELTTAVDSGVSVFIDQLAMMPMVRHQNGPLLAMFPGDTKFVIDDQFNVTVTNDRAGDFQTFFDRAFNMTSRQLQLPSNGAGAETILDSLVSA